MKLNKSEVKALKYISFGARDRSDLAEALNVTENRITPIIKKLKNNAFITIKVDNRRKIIELSDIRPVNSFKQMMIINPGIKLSEFLYGFNLRLLTFCLYSWKSTVEISKQFNISGKTVLNRTLKLRERQLLNKKGKMFRFNKKTWKNLYDFLDAYRNFTIKKVNVLWKYEKEMVFEVNKNEAEGTLTGFSAYPYFNVYLNTIRHCCYLPEKKLSKEAVFLHSLMQIRKNVRLLELAIVFFYKNKLNRNKLIRLSSNFDCKNLLDEFFKTLELNIVDKEEIRELPLTSIKSINEMLNENSLP